MKEKYGSRAQLLFTDTDSLMYDVVTDDIYGDMAKDAERYDMSNFNTTNKYYKPEYQQNKAVVGLMKDEAAGHPIGEFVGLKPKMYSFQTMKMNSDGTTELDNKHRAKGIRNAVADKITHEHFLTQLRKPEENFVFNRRLGSRLHQVYGIAVDYHIFITHYHCIILYLNI